MGASTDQAADAIADETVRVVKSFIENGKPVNLVNGQQKSPAPYGLVVRHYNQVGVLAGVLDALKTSGVNVEEMENSVFSGGEAAVCSLKLDQEPKADAMEKIIAQKAVIQTTLTK